MTALTATMVDEHPLTDGSGSGRVTVDDVALFLARFSGGALASFEASRMATGAKNALRLEIHGSRGALMFDLERLDELWIHDATAPATEHGFRRVLVTEHDHPWMEAWWPPGHIIGWEHTFVHQLRDLLDDVHAGRDPRPSFADGLALQRMLDAVVRSAAAGATVTVT